MDAERICEEGNEQPSASILLKFLRKRQMEIWIPATWSRMSPSNQQTPQFCTGTKKVKMSSGITVIIQTRSKVNRSIKRFVRKNEMENERDRANENGNRDEHTVKAQEPSEEEVPVDTGVNENGVERKDCQEVEQHILLFGETLLKRLERRTRKEKQQLKWNGKVQELKEFVTLVWKASGSWSTKNYAGKVNQHIFQEKKKSRTINFWPNSKTLIVQGNEKIAERINYKTDKIVELMSKGSEESTV